MDPQRAGPWCPSLHVLSVNIAENCCGNLGIAFRRSHSAAVTVHGSIRASEAASFLSTRRDTDSAVWGGAQGWIAPIPVMRGGAECQNARTLEKRQHRKQTTRPRMIDTITVTSSPGYSERVISLQ
ncbi:hypothetical protein HN011_003278 [Eciton burchellii]|nr:hypothetical protein HN011_003278 [Eciton burchellii]